MNPIKLFFSFSGRITRLAYWLGSIAVSIPIYIAIYMIKPEVFTAVLEPENIELQRIAAAPSWPLAIMTLIAMIPITALLVKRFNDRNRPYWLGFAIGGIYALISAAFYLGLMPGLTPEAPVPGATPELTSAMIATLVVALVGCILSLWFIIDVGFLRGTKGPNQYGPDPKGDAA